MKLVLSRQDINNLRFICECLISPEDQAPEFRHANISRAREYAQRLGMALDSGMAIELEAE